MKLKLLALSLALGCATTVSAATLNKVRLSWDAYPPDEITNVSFNVYQTTNVALPMSNWMILTNVTIAQSNAPTPYIDLNVNPGQYYFSMTASNAFWGESDFSAVASTPMAPRSGTNVKIKKLP